jgi:hypothetical protein
MAALHVLVPDIMPATYHLRSARSDASVFNLVFEPSHIKDLACVRLRREQARLENTDVSARCDGAWKTNAVVAFQSRRKHTMGLDMYAFTTEQNIRAVDFNDPNARVANHRSCCSGLKPRMAVSDGSSWRDFSPTILLPEFHPKNVH